jgi:hypothetical protein
MPSGTAGHLSVLDQSLFAIVRRLARLESEVGTVKMVMRKYWPHEFEPLKTKGGILLPSGADVQAADGDA